MAAKHEILRLHKKRADREAAEAEAARQQREQEKAAEQERKRAARLSRQPEHRENEDEAALFIRDNFEWVDYAELWVPEYSSYSDYSGTFLEKSNVAAWLDQFPEIFTTASGGAGTVWCGIKEETRLTVGAQRPEEFDTLKDWVEGLHNYPVLDEDGESRMEMEAQWKEWEDDGRDEVRKYLAKEASTPDGVIAAYSINDAELDELFSEHSMDEHMVVEAGCSIYFNVKAAMRDITIEHIMGDDLEQRVWQAKLAVFKAGVDERFEQAVESLWGAEHPELPQAVARLSVEARLHLLDLLINDIDEYYDAWDVEKPDHIREGPIQPTEYLSIEDRVLADAAKKLTLARIQHATPEDPRQMHLKFEGRARKVIEGETLKQFLKRRKDIGPQRGIKQTMRFDEVPIGYRFCGFKGDLWTKVAKGLAVRVKDGKSKTFFDSAAAAYATTLAVEEGEESPKAFLKRKNIVPERGPSIDKAMFFSNVPDGHWFRVASTVFKKLNGDMCAIKESPFPRELDNNYRYPFGAESRVYPADWTAEEAKEEDVQWRLGFGGL